ncbi:acetoacetyl-CoA reductase [Massilia antarctica]|uniref:acetoacetyl-CoA reductase n=1 Tax=Massilia antarctica TaxID=2765360 RepID=UPI0006BB8511|nr:acetoacetyl-CoA reductase [Massilia sp. H27-R4]MCY0914285.1 acetoacetyl-CoA reductase [Massilia sp. H27-R4]CUI08698.1 Acetoacetyl-CoA reductase [Janthinobacterium sp. CG23_2]CUU32484.1 Acetoacetyl-CoA reductase [Janthinobacterium sp. CG23_2]
MQRIALVTGGTRGLGRAIALALRDAGHRLAVVYVRDTGAARRFTEETAIPAYQWNVGDYHACRLGVLKVAYELGPVDILVNNAGVTGDTMLHKMTPEQWWNVVHTNLGSMFNMTRQVVGGMRERHFGRVINISSVNGRKGQAGQANYAASKAGVLGFTRALALENASKNVTVNAIAPGYCDTGMLAALAPGTLQAIVAGIPVGRIGAPPDIGRMAAFLASDDAGFITGATFDVNGGQFMG